jgi:hypothetical protein
MSTGVAAEQAYKHRARNAEVSAESRFTFTTLRHREVPRHAGLLWTRRSARPSLSGTRRNGLKPRAHPAPTKQQGGRSVG